MFLTRWKTYFFEGNYIIEEIIQTRPSVSPSFPPFSRSPFVFVPACVVWNGM